MIINVHAGHNPEGKVACGASGILNESKEDRIVKDKVVAMLNAQGHTVYDCTEDDGNSQNDVLNKIVKKCNSHKVDLDVSIHFNAGANDYNGNGRSCGTEVWVYPNGGADDIANRVCTSIAELGFTNRGVKSSKDLYVLRKTHAVAMLVECCFVDDKEDASIYNSDKMAAAIVKGITGVNMQIHSSAQTSHPTMNPSPSRVPFEAHAYYQVIAEGKNYSEVCDLSDYAGVENRKISDLALRVDKGSVRYRVHVLGGNWLGWVTGYNWSDNSNGYAGCHKSIDAIQVYYNTPNGYAYKKAKYRVSTTGSVNYLGWVYDDSDYAGIFGKPIDKIQICLENA